MNWSEKFKQALTAIKVIMALIGPLKELIKAVEIPGFGPEKKQAVLDAISAMMKELPWEISDEVQALVLKILGALIDIIVAVYNLLGHDWAKA